MYCIKCKKVADTSNVQYAVSKNGRKHETRKVHNMRND